VITGATLRELRHRAGRSQSDVAAAVGIPATVLSAYERERRQPGIETASRIIDELGFHVRFVPRTDPEVQARRLVEVLTLAEALPYRPRPLASARRPDRT
jgi:transcriptional regulator with XRE-family HTH domain